MDKHLLEQHPPHEFSRPPRSITKHLSYWKAHEFRSWLLFYSLPVLLDHLPSLYLHHFSLLVTAMHILLNAELSHAQLAAAEEMLNLFCSFLPELYGDRFCTANAHALTHMAMYVRLWGPLWTQSAFGFESINGHLRKVIHGKSHVIDQMGFSIDVSMTLKSLEHTLVGAESEETLLYISDLLGNQPRTNMTKLRDHCYSSRSHGTVCTTTCKGRNYCQSIPRDLALWQKWLLFRMIVRELRQ